MKQKMMRRREAFTINDLFVVIIVVAVLVAVGLRALRPAKRHPSDINCVNNLKEVGMAYSLWAGDNGDLLPSQQSVSKGGWKELLTNANQGAICWTNYAIMQNEVGQSPRLVLCPFDERLPAQSFTNDFEGLWHNLWVILG